MAASLSSLLEVSIDFEQSHLFFPRLVAITLLVLLVMIVAIYGRSFLAEVRSGQRSLAFFDAHSDKFRLFGTIGLTVAYFQLMDWVGSMFPNMGYGFLFVSMPFMFLMSLLYVHGLDKRKLTGIALNALIAPSVAWYVLANLFNISLP